MKKCKRKTGWKHFVFQKSDDVIDQNLKTAIDVLS